jgi:catechol 2,3-dioxygenase-like lactoylglutathione lyase family enzyme
MMNAVKTHLSLNVVDVEKSTAWYEAFFGVPAHKRRPGYANFDIESPGLKLALNQSKPEGTGTLNHLGILVESTADVLAAKERVEKSGLATFSEENVNCCYAVQDKIWVRDPDGNQWEVYTILDDLEHEHEHHAQPAEGQACCAGSTSPCCSS